MNQRRKMLCLPLRSTRGILYLLEPILLGIIFIIMFAFLTPQPRVEPNYRMLELHAQDVISVFLRDGAIEYCHFDRICLERRIGKLVAELNVGYGYDFEIVGEVDPTGHNGKNTIVVERKFWIGNDVYLMRLWLWI